MLYRVHLAVYCAYLQFTFINVHLFIFIILKAAASAADPLKNWLRGLILQGVPSVRFILASGRFPCDLQLASVKAGPPNGMQAPGDSGRDASQGSQL